MVKAPFVSYSFDSTQTMMGSHIGDGIAVFVRKIEISRGVRKYKSSDDRE